MKKEYNNIISFYAFLESSDRKQEHSVEFFLGNRVIVLKYKTKVSITDTYYISVAVSDDDIGKLNTKGKVVGVEPSVHHAINEIPNIQQSDFIFAEDVHQIEEVFIERWKENAVHCPPTVSKIEDTMFRARKSA